MATLYCGCRHRVWTERGAVMVFMDNQAHSESYGKQVEDRPGCGKKLRLELLKSDKHPTRDHLR